MLENVEVQWWRTEAKRNAINEARQAIDALADAGLELDNWHKDCLAGALSAIFNGLYTLSVRCSQNALLSQDKREDGSGISLDPVIARLGIQNFREILRKAEIYPVVQPHFGK
jgi:hypothetical protein